MNEFEPLLPDDVVRVDSFVLVKHSPFLGSQLLSALQTLLGAERAASLTNDDGVRCQVLRPGEDWQKGKLRIRLEFCPDSSPVAKDPLDEFRQ